MIFFVGLYSSLVLWMGHLVSHNLPFCSFLSVIDKIWSRIEDFSLGLWFFGLFVRILEDCLTTTITTGRNDRKRKKENQVILTQWWKQIFPTIQLKFEDKLLLELKNDTSYLAHHRKTKMLLIGSKGTPKAYKVYL